MHQSLHSLRVALPQMLRTPCELVILTCSQQHGENSSAVETKRKQLAAAALSSNARRAKQFYKVTVKVGAPEHSSGNRQLLRDHLIHHAGDVPMIMYA